MDFERAFAFAEGYARGYVAYLFAFFGQAPRASEPEEAADPLKSVLIYGLVSAALGGSLGYFGSYARFPPPEWLMERVAKEFTYWISLGLVLFAILRALRTRPEPMDILVVVLGVAPVAFALGGYAAFLTHNVVAALPPGWREWAPWSAYAVNVTVQLAVSATYLPVYLRRLPEVGPRRNVAATVIAMLLIGAVQYAAVRAHLSRTDEGERVAVLSSDPVPATEPGCLRPCT